MDVGIKQFFPLLLYSTIFIIFDIKIYKKDLVYYNSIVLSNNIMINKYLLLITFVSYIL